MIWDQNPDMLILILYCFHVLCQYDAAHDPMRCNVSAKVLEMFLLKSIQTISTQRVCVCVCLQCVCVHVCV